MHKPRVHWHLDQALFVLVIMAGAIVAAVLDVEAISAAAASGRYGLGTDAVAAAASAAAASAPRAGRHTVVARVVQ